MKPPEHNYKAQERDNHKAREREREREREKREDRTSLRIKEPLGGNQKVNFMFTFTIA